MKKNMGELLEVLRDANVGSVMAFRLIEKSKAANYTQALETIKDNAKEVVSPDDASITTASITIHNPSVDNLEVSAEKK
jgi:uracil phosphoribosyltransferase